METDAKLRSLSHKPAGRPGKVCRFFMENTQPRIHPELGRPLGPGDDLLMINSPDYWPCYPVLPVKNYASSKPGDFPMTGIIVAGHTSVVLIGTLGLTDWTTAESKTYPSVEALLAAGWIVD